MSIEQEGVSPATAGGASAPIIDLSAFQAAGKAWAEAYAAQSQARGAFFAGLIGGLHPTPEADSEPEPSDSEPGKLRTIANALHAMLGEGDCVEHTVTLGHVWYLVRLVDGHLDVISDGNRRGPQKPDPRDAEIERLRKELRQREQRGFDAYAELLNPIRAVFGKPPVTASHYRELHDSITALIGRLNAKESIKDKALTERDKAREEWDRLRAERDAMAPALVEIQNILNTLDRDAQQTKPAEPRRWTAGDPEPEIGTVVRAQDDERRQWTRRRHGWHPDHDCSERQCGGALPTWWELPRPLVEVVGTDG